MLYLHPKILAAFLLVILISLPFLKLSNLNLSFKTRVIAGRVNIASSSNSRYLINLGGTGTNLLKPPLPQLLVLRGLDNFNISF